MKVTHTRHVLKWTKQSQPLQRTAVNSWTFPKSFQLISHREIAELQQIRVVWGVLILWNRFSHVGWISRPDYSPHLIRILAFVQRGSHSLISSSNVTTRDQPWADHPETACDYTINELFNSHYFIVIRNERTWRNQKSVRLSSRRDLLQGGNWWLRKHHTTFVCNKGCLPAPGRDRILNI